MPTEQMVELWPLLFSFAAGLALGLFYFGGLWLTVSRLEQARQPGILFAGSFLVRSVIVLLGITILTGADFGRIAACMFGFILARMILTRRWGPSAAPKKPEEANNNAATI